MLIIVGKKKQIDKLEFINKRKATDEPFILHKVIIENSSDGLPLEIFCKNFKNKYS